MPICLCVGACTIKDLCLGSITHNNRAITCKDKCLTCGSHILHCALVITTSHTNAGPKCASCCAELVSTESVSGRNRRILRYSQHARYAPQTYRRSGRHETLRTSDIRQSSLASSKLRTQPYRGDTVWCEMWMRARATWYVMVLKSMFLCTMWYALIWKKYVCMYHMICFGVRNECVHVANCVCCVVTNCWKQLSWYWNKLELPKA